MVLLLRSHRGPLFHRESGPLPNQRSAGSVEYMLTANHFSVARNISAGCWHPWPSSCAWPSTCPLQLNSDCAKFRDTVSLLSHSAFQISLKWLRLIGLSLCQCSPCVCRYSQTEFYRMYLTACGCPTEEMEEEIRKLHEEVTVFTLPSHFLWSLWGFASALTSDIVFDYSVSHSSSLLLLLID